MTIVNTEQWEDKCFVSLSIKDGSNYQYEAYTSNITFGGGDKDFTGKPINSGGRVKDFTPQTDFTVDIDSIPVSASLTDGGVTQIFDGVTTLDTEDPYSSTNTRNNTDVRLVLLWTNDTTVTAATDAVAASSEGYRLTYINGHVTTETGDWADMRLTGKFTFKCPAFNKTGTGNRTVDSTETAGIAVSGDYT